MLLFLVLLNCFLGGIALRIIYDELRPKRKRKRK